MTLQHFAIKTDDAGFTAIDAALLARGQAIYGPSFELARRPTADDAAVEIIDADIDEADLTGDLAGLHRDSYPNVLCQHRYGSHFRTFGFHALGESERSTEGVAGRRMRWIRPPILPTTANYGAGNGTNDYNAFNGPQDLAIGVDDDGGASGNRHRTGRTYVTGFGAHVRIGTGQNPSAGPGNVEEGTIYVEDAAGLGEAGAINLRGDHPIFPGMLWGTRTTWETFGGLPWEEYDSANHIWVNGRLNGNNSAVQIGTSGTLWDADVDDVTVDLDTLLKRHGIAGKPNLSDLNGPGGRCRYHSQSVDAYYAPDIVLAYDGVSTYDDITAEVLESGTLSAIALPVGAPDGAGLYIGVALPCSNFLIDFITNGTGQGTYTGDWEYSRGGSAFAVPTTIVDNQNDLKVGAGFDTGTFFNPKIDWATDTIDSNGPYLWLRWRKTGGSVTRAVTIDRIRIRRDATFFHRWNDGAPTRGLCDFSGGMRYRVNDKGNVRFINFRAAVTPANAEWLSSPDVTFKTMQFGSCGDLHKGSGTPIGVTWGPSTDGPGRWWAIDDHIVQDPAHRVIATELIGRWGDDPAYYAEIDKWCDFSHFGNGFYPDNAGTEHILSYGVKFRNAAIQQLNLSGDVIADYYGGDNHSFAMRGMSDWRDPAKYRLEQIGIENLISNVLYTHGTGGSDKPVSGTCGPQAGFMFKHGYCVRWNGREDVSQICHGFNWSGDGDTGHYGDDAANFEGNGCQYWVFMDLAYSFSNIGGVGTIIDNNPGPLTVRKVSYINCNWAWAANKGFNESLWTFVYDQSAGTYADVTNNLKASGNTTTAMFPAVPAAGDIFVCAVKATLPWRPRKAGLTFTTPASMGTAVVEWVYWRNDNSWAAVSNLSGGGLTSNNTMTFNQPTDYGTLSINGTDYWAMGCRLVSGAFATAPTLVDVVGGSNGTKIDIDEIYVEEPAIGIGYARTGGTWMNRDIIIEGDNITVRLRTDQSIGATPLWAWISGGTPNKTLAQWQATPKLALTTDALEDSRRPATITVV